MFLRLAPALATAARTVGTRSSFAGSSLQLMRGGHLAVAPQTRQLTVSPVCMGR